MIRIAVVKTAVVTAFKRLVAFGTADSSRDLLWQLDFLLTRPADQCFDGGHKDYLTLTNFQFASWFRLFVKYANRFLPKAFGNKIHNASNLSTKTYLLRNLSGYPDNNVAVMQTELRRKN
jgi:hypothetical protein